MANWSLGVGIPIDNRSFKVGSYGEDQLATLYTAGLTLPMNSDNRNLFGTKDTIIVGPSNNASHSGKSETAIVAAIGSDYITLNSSLTYNYAASDYVSGLGNRVAGGWIPQNDYASGLQCLGFDTDGKNHNSAQKFRVVASSPGEGDPVFFKLRQTIDANIFLPSTVYRVGFYYKFILNALDPKLFCNVNDGVNNFVNVTVTGNNTTSYTLFTAIATTNSGNLNSSGNIDVIIEVDSDDEEDCTVFIDQVFIEHAVGTDGATSGVYTFTEQIEPDKLQWERIDSFRRIQLRNLATKIYDSSGTQGKQYMHKITVQFDDVSNTFYDNLLTLWNYQLDGNFLVLHHDVENITPTSYGMMTLSNFRYNHWCEQLVSFTFVFEGVT